ncbi:MAG: pilus assembly PilX N-terminal domain-containing protein [Candidatus Omnitrophota bacterium]|nr:pilus assembly PilX N-terminal domain-containing protein [Candidatus Omnitrophota bacterium]
MNKRGVALILAYMVMAGLAIISTAFVLRSVSESSIAKNYTNSARAFWISEAGMAQAYYNWSHSVAQPAGAVNFGGGSFTINTAGLPQVTVSGAFGGTSRSLQASFTRIPPPFDNTLSCGGNLSLSGFLAKVEVWNQTRISGAFTKGAGTSSWFQDKQEGVSQDLTTIKVPDYNNNGTQNEFNDFVLFGREAVASYPSEETVYIQDNGTVNIFPNEALIGKKVIFVEGAAAGQGNVNIFFDASWQAGEDITVISTGKINYVEPLQLDADSRLSTASWSDYGEAAIFRSEHESVIYSQSNANFVDILEWGSTTGNLIVNGNVSLKEVLTYEKYFHSDRAKNGDMPPGFQFLGGALGTPLLRDWQEI